jgi:hypothetical protein
MLGAARREHRHPSSSPSHTVAATGVDNGIDNGIGNGDNGDIAIEAPIVHRAP